MDACWGTVPGAGPPLRLRQLRRGVEMVRRCLVTCCFLALAAITAHAQARPDLSGAWGPYRGGRGADPKLAAVPAAPPVLKEPYAKPYAERRAATTAATQRGEPGATNGMLCVPYGFPTMMSVAVYPVEILQSPKQVTV